MAVVKTPGENPLDRVLDDANKKMDEGQSTSGGLLAKYWRQIMADLRMGSISFNERIQQYLELIYPGSNKIAASNARGSYNKKFAAPEFTWKVFLEALKVMGVWKIEFSVKLHHIDGKTTTHVTDALLMNSEQRRKFEDKWNATHGVHPIKKEELERLEAQRQAIKRAKEEKLNEANNLKISKSGKVIIQRYYKEELEGNNELSEADRKQLLEEAEIVRQATPIKSTDPVSESGNHDDTGGTEVPGE